MKVTIKARFGGAVLFEGEYESTKHALEDARNKGAYLEGAYLEGAYLGGANLEGAYLEGAYLEGAYLGGANLEGANLRGANLEGAYLEGANLRGAYLEGAYLEGAYLEGANLRGANLGDKRLVGKTPILCIGPIGSREAYLTAYNTDAGIFIATGCFFGSLKDFAAKVKEKHKSGRYFAEYKAAIAMIKATFKARAV